MNTDIAAIRADYTKNTLTESEVNTNPLNQLQSWWQQAVNSGLTEVNAFTLATASADGVPWARIVLAKDINDRGIVFFTNYNSIKGIQLAENPKACALFFWKELERQVRITGLVSKVTAAENDAYFSSRPYDSQLGALTSPQSQVIPNRQWLNDTFESLKTQYNGAPVTRPEHWGGYLIQPVIVEFWQGGHGRLHDRLQYTLQEDGNWLLERLAP